MPASDDQGDGQANSTYQDLLRRREYLAATAGAAMLAGCSTESDDGNGNGNGNGGNGDTGDTVTDTEAKDLPVMSRIGESTLPGNLNFNPFAAENVPAKFTMDFWHERAGDVYANGEVKLFALDDWNWDGDSQTLTKTLRDDLVFWNGDQFTAEDLYTYAELNRLLGPDASKFEEINQVDELSVEYVYKDSLNPKIIRNLDVLDRFFWETKEQWQPWFEQVQDASTQDELDEISKDLQEYEVGIDEYVDNGWGNGVFVPTEWSETEIISESIHEDHRWAGDVDIEKMRMYVAGYDTSRADELFINGDVDFHTSALGSKYEGQVPEYIENLKLFPIMMSHMVSINQRNHEALRDYNVRRAMAAVINTGHVSTNFSESGSDPIEAHTGMDPGTNEEYWGDDLSSLIDYSPQESDYELADSYLEEAGYSREGGTIYGPDGNEMEKITFQNDASGLLNVPGETASLQLEEYGFPIEYNTLPPSQKQSLLHDSPGEWDLTCEPQYAYFDRHPTSFFKESGWGYGYRLDAENWSSSQAEQWNEEGKERSPVTGREFAPEVPVDLGQEDLSGQTERVNVLDTFNEVRASSDEDWNREQVRKLSWMWNFHVPNIQVLYWVAGHVGNTRDYDWPTDNRLTTDNAQYPYIQNGTVTYSDRHK